MVDNDGQAPENPAASDFLQPPRLYFESITFSDGTTLCLSDEDIVVFVGPNNSGKSAALRELEQCVGRNVEGAVVKSTKIVSVGTKETLLSFLKDNSHKTGLPGQISYSGMGYHIYEGHVSYFGRENDRHPVAPFFAKRLATETRIQDSNPAPAVALFQEPPTHPIHMLLMDDLLASDINSKFRHAFGKDLTAFRAGGGSFPLYIGNKPTLPVGKDELSREFVEDLLRTNVPLHEQGDGVRSFAAVIIHILVSTTHSIQFLDEPEAFLHPPQARLLGRYIAQSRKQKSQLFIATHSADVLEGLIEGGTDNVRIVRIRRDGDINPIHELSKEKTKEISKDTLTRFSRVFDGIFFEHVVVCESDADCLFYQSFLNLKSISGDRRPDVLFVHASGKHRMAKLAGTLRALGVPVSVIADVDLLNDENVFRVLLETLGGDWSKAEAHWKAVSASVDARRPPLNATQVAGLIQTAIDDVAGTGEFPPEKEKAIKAIFRSLSPWSPLKQGGRSMLPGGETTKHFDRLVKASSDVGLWIVPVGEVEGFCRSIGSHGPGFVERVIEERDLAADEELRPARDFVRQIWKAARTPSDISKSECGSSTLLHQIASIDPPRRPASMSATTTRGMPGPAPSAVLGVQGRAPSAPQISSPFQSRSLPLAISRLFTASM